jgi:rod shape-determining protein MreC
VRRERRRLRLVLAVLLLTSFTLLTLEVRSGRDGPLHSLRGSIASLVSPVGDAIGSVLAPIGDGASAAFHVRRDKRRTRELEKSVIDLRRQVATQGQLIADSAALTGLQRLAARGAFKVVPTYVVGVGSPVEDFREVITIDVGSADGVGLGDAVVSQDGFVGRIVDVQARRSMVSLLTDESLVVGVQLADDASKTELATVRGAGKDALLDFTLAERVFPLKTGTRLVTYPGGYVEGIPVGVVDTVTTRVGGLAQTATVRPYADLNTLDVLAVVISQDRDHPRSALPALPSPSPSPQPSPEASPSPGSPADSSTPAGTGGAVVASPVAPSTAPQPVTTTAARPRSSPSPSRTVVSASPHPARTTARSPSPHPTRSP